MTKILPLIRLALLVALATFACLLLWELREFVKHFDHNQLLLSQQTSQLVGHVDEVLSQGDQTIAYANGTITQFRNTATLVNQAAVGQLATLDRTNTEVLKASGRLSDLFGYLAEDLHGPKEHPGAIPTLTLTLNHLDEQIAALKPGVEAFNESMGQLPPIFADAKGMTADGKLMTANGVRITDDGAAFVHRELAPVRGTWNVIKGFLTTFAGPAASVATAIK